VWGAALSADGKTAATAGSDKTLKIWAVDKGASTFTLEGNHAKGVRGCAISGDGRVVLTMVCPRAAHATPPPPPQGKLRIGAHGLL
jgi:WD40 repeat protein